ncbi:glycosyltransferase family 25 protein [Pseudaminobacter sp. NGMCC 1.201702]|uniref:hypothetical protein n=1 Tax=Pseudaminobacter sp. NGMCC 1.201702 TaxID=3391825 RepID=UPI0039EE47BB
MLPTLVMIRPVSKERWARINASAKDTGLAVQRVAAVDRVEIPAELRHGLDAKKFHHSNGREDLAGE